MISIPVIWAETSEEGPVEVMRTVANAISTSEDFLSCIGR